MGLGAGIATRRRRPWAGLAAASILAGLVLCGPATAARLTAAAGVQAERYGRITLTFDTAVTVKARISGAVLVIAFSERSTAFAERLAAQMPDYVSVVRRDPDGTGLRLALQRPYRINVQSAGETTFIDLLPLDWSGLPPPLPPEVVAELFARTQAAEAALRAARPKPPEPARLSLELALRPNLARLSLRLPESATARFERDGAATRLDLPGAWRIDDTATRGRLKPAIAALSVEEDATGVRLLVTPAEGYEIRSARDADGATLDVVPRASETKPVEARAPDAPDGARKTAGEAGTGQSEAKPIAPAAVKPPASASHPVVIRPAGPGLVFPFTKMPAAALFERAGIATLVFETSESVTIPAGDPVLSPLGSPDRTGGFVTIRLPVPRERLLDLVPSGPADAPTGWELVAGTDLSASEPLSATRTAGANGRLGVGVKLPNPGGATWLDLDGERIAVVTGYGPKPAGIPKRQTFVDFELLPSRQGVAVLARADDLHVRPDIDGVAIGRDAGMAVSGVARAVDVPLAGIGDLAVERAPWEASRRGGVRDLLRRQLEAVTEASSVARGPLRLTLAKGFLANGLTVEAYGVLKVAVAEDPVLSAQRDVALLVAIAAARMGHTAEARHILDGDGLKSDPEVRLWQGYLDTLAGRWGKADAAFRETSGILERYPDDLQVLLRSAAAEAAIEAGDWDSASRHLTLAGARSPEASERDRLLLLRARIDEVTGRTVAAQESYRRLTEAGRGPVAADAALRAAILGHASGKLPLAETIDRIEALALTWHGDEIETRAIAALANLYRDAGRWRQAFTAARRADVLRGQSPIARALHDSAMALFEELYLGERGANLSGVEALALYFDFKDFAPIDRRGDEIVRRLSDRLVKIDLLDSAGDLLQHQVDRRLTGPARAEVAARLATIRLMDEKPLAALQVLDATYLPELPEDLRRARALLRARALSDLSRTDLALETIDGEPGADAARLRADILWTGRRWREAGEAHETLVGDAWRQRVPLDDTARTDVLRAAIAYGLANETLSLERLRAKFANPMAEGVDARTFALLTQPNAVRTTGFREIAQKATSAETLRSFLTEYRKRYPDSAVPERAGRDGETRADAEGGPATPPG
ncbi:hypothetical protein FV218_14015 [Methylobacterium sp. WL69]|uniref:hypothetical protein n=1 Tax=Methylobacterium sp. WL69 TaxID=2603893 RepID=UPI0011CC6DBB|nr:hypothetical protein [Methylobacterium sp. WL69]TXM72097.1 hypothetical protein FV218_14015 [Methylobacterium sp. WL69]